jgi:hypothetical protein
MSDTPTVVRELARREVARHRDLLVGLTVSTPTYKSINGLTEFVVDVRIGTDPNVPVVKDVVVVSSAVGVVNDFRMPVLVERSEAGILTVVGRSDILLPDVSVRSYSLHELGLDFMSSATQDESGDWHDGFGFPAPDPTAAVGTEVGYAWELRMILFGEKDWGAFDFGEVIYQWTET